MLAAALQQGGRSQQCPYSELGRLGCRVEYCAQPPRSLGEVAAVEPEAPDTCAERECALRIVSQRRVECGADVVVIELQLRERRRRGSQRQRPVAEAAFDGLSLTGGVQALVGDLAHG